MFVSLRLLMVILDIPSLLYSDCFYGEIPIIQLAAILSQSAYIMCVFDSVKLPHHVFWIWYAVGNTSTFTVRSWGCYHIPEISSPYAIFKKCKNSGRISDESLSWLKNVSRWIIHFCKKTFYKTNRPIWKSSFAAFWIGRWHRKRRSQEDRGLHAGFL